MGETGDAADFEDAIQLARGEQHTGVARMGWEDRHASPDWGQLALSIDGTEIRQDGQRALKRLVIRLLIPREGRRITPAGRKQQQDGLGEVDALDFRDFAERAGFVVGLRPKSDAAAGTGSASATGALLGGRLRDRFNEQGVDAAMRVEAGDAG